MRFVLVVVLFASVCYAEQTSGIENLFDGGSKTGRFFGWGGTNRLHNAIGTLVNAQGHGLDSSAWCFKLTKSLVTPRLYRRRAFQFRKFDLKAGKQDMTGSIHVTVPVGFNKFMKPMWRQIRLHAKTEWSLENVDCMKVAMKVMKRVTAPLLEKKKDFVDELKTLCRTYVIAKSPEELNTQDIVRDVVCPPGFVDTGAHPLFPKRSDSKATKKLKKQELVSALVQVVEDAQIALIDTLDRFFGTIGRNRLKKALKQMLVPHDKKLDCDKLVKQRTAATADK
jgi:hypothetical protein